MSTRADIRTRARIRADQDNSTFPTDAQYNYWIDAACKEVWYDLIESGWPINFTVGTVTMTANPTDCGFDAAFVRGVFYNDGGAWRELPRLPEDKRADYMATGSGRAEYYDIRIDPTNGPALWLFPPQTSGSYVVHYVGEHPGLAADGTSWYGPARSDELVVLRAAAKGCRKENNDQAAAQLDKEYDMMLDSVKRMASWFDMRGGAGTIRDVGPLATTRMPFDYDI